MERRNVLWDYSVNYFRVQNFIFCFMKNTVIKGSGKMKNFNKYVAVLFIVLFLTVALCGCGSSQDKLIGQWVLEEYEAQGVFSFPDNIIFQDGGIGYCDGRIMSWYIKDNMIVFSSGAWDGEEFDYQLSGSILKLHTSILSNN